MGKTKRIWGTANISESGGWLNTGSCIEWLAPVIVDGEVKRIKVRFLGDNSLPPTGWTMEEMQERGKQEVLKTAASHVDRRILTVGVDARLQSKGKNSEASTVAYYLTDDGSVVEDGMRLGAEGRYVKANGVIKETPFEITKWCYGESGSPNRLD